MRMCHDDVPFDESKVTPTCLTLAEEEESAAVAAAAAILTSASTDEQLERQQRQQEFLASVSNSGFLH